MKEEDKEERKEKDRNVVRTKGTMFVFDNDDRTKELR